MSLIVHYTNLAENQRQMVAATFVNPLIKPLFEAELAEIREALGLIDISKADSEIMHDYKQLRMAAEVYSSIIEFIDYALDERKIVQLAQKQQQKNEDEDNEGPLLPFHFG